MEIYICVYHLPTPRNVLYSVVVFTEEDTVDVVATKWITDNGTAVYWPPTNKGQSISRLVMGLVVPNNDWKKCPVIVEHSYKTYNVARTAAMKKADTGEVLDSEVTDKEKGRGKRRITKAKHFDDTDEDMDNVNAVLNYRKKKKKAIVSSESDDDRRSLPAAEVSGIREKLKALQQRNASTSKDVCCIIYTKEE
ncbi:uncharacterized protein LOC118646616 [Monomorium pharaonis]|uniref:uncharacterized protein LOC105829968 n=1 Tax=Monomorium pharaonis TaxID=307658 RepID=UPI00063F378A|nr:uncharacterized protein LOC105829968 [Monomorium pharaonis]XP_036145786.1 uncharacterized protein LOC118646616 [Monomorium pharaonis]